MGIVYILYYMDIGFNAVQCNLFFLFTTLIYYYTGTRSTSVVHILNQIYNFSHRVLIVCTLLIYHAWIYNRRGKKLLTPLDSIYLIFSIIWFMVMIIMILLQQLDTYYNKNKADIYGRQKIIIIIVTMKVKPMHWPSIT